MTYFKNKLKIKALPENLEDVIFFIEEKISNSNRRVSEEILDRIKLASEEIFINIATYAYGDNIGEVVIGIDIKRKYVVVTFEDCGVPFNPLEKENPDLSIPIDKREIGGLGIYLVKRLMTDVTYNHKKGRNILTITAQLNPA